MNNSIMYGYHDDPHIIYIIVTSLLCHNCMDAYSSHCPLSLLTIPGIVHCLGMSIQVIELFINNIGGHINF